MALRQILVGKAGCATAPLTLVQGDSNTQIIQMIVQRYYGGVDLGKLTWDVVFENGEGATDTHYLTDIRVGDVNISCNWKPHGLATSTAGQTKFQLEGYAEDENGAAAMVWQSGFYYFNVSEDMNDVTTDGENEALTDVHKLILYVNTELPGVIQAGTDAAAAAEAANKAAEAADTATAQAVPAAQAASAAASNAQTAADNATAATTRATTAAESAETARDNIQEDLNSLKERMPVVGSDPETHYVLEQSDIDVTLSVTGKVADAGVVGEKIGELSEEIVGKAPAIIATQTGLIVECMSAENTLATVENAGTKIFRGTKNLLNAKDYVYDKSSYGMGVITMTKDGKHHVASGTPTATIVYTYGNIQVAYENGLYVPAGTYKLSLRDVSTGKTPDFTGGWGVRYWDDTTKTLVTSQKNYLTTNEIDLVFDEPHWVQPFLTFTANVEVPETTVMLQLEQGSVMTDIAACGYAEFEGDMVTMVDGVNTIWSDSGEITATYVADTKTYIDENACSDALDAFKEQYKAEQAERDTRIDNHETRIDTAEASVQQNTTDIASLKSDKLSKTQAVSDAGKYLHIGSDGVVSAESIGAPTSDQVTAAVTAWMDEHPGITMQYDTLDGEVGVINPQYIWGDVRRYGIFPDGVTNWNGSTSYVDNAISNSINLGLEIFWPAGYYASQINIMRSNVQMRFADGAEFGGLIHVVSPRSQNREGAEDAPIENITLHGTVCTYGRYGQTDAVNVWIDRLHLKADGAKDIDNGIAGRGVHIYWGNDGFWCNEMVVDHCDDSMTTLDAAVAIDGYGNNPKNFHIGKIRVKDSKVHGLYLTGTGHWIGEVVVDAFGAGAYSGPGLQDSNNQAQSQELCGVWLNRVRDCYIGKISVNQNTADERPNAKYSVRIDETGIASFDAIKIDQINVQNVRGDDRGVTFGDVNYDPPRCYADVGQVLVSADSAYGDADYGLVTLSAKTAVNVHAVYVTGKGSRPAILNNSTVSTVGLQVT